MPPAPEQCRIPTAGSCLQPNGRQNIRRCRHRMVQSRAPWLPTKTVRRATYGLTRIPKELRRRPRGYRQPWRPAGRDFHNGSYCRTSPYRAIVHHWNRCHPTLDANRSSGRRSLQNTDACSRQDRRKTRCRKVLCRWTCPYRRIHGCHPEAGPRSHSAIPRMWSSTDGNRALSSIP